MNIIMAQVICSVAFIMNIHVIWLLLHTGVMIMQSTLQFIIFVNLFMHCRFQQSVVPTSALKHYWSATLADLKRNSKDFWLVGFGW